ncbi:hypothetical protein B0H16DRAFT_122446 [Mycena metata]|uniref:Glycosyltransferase 61 catalytic domain-containing protein n=1 Tax=Mycena metata TaxID=1033252 RepID=A0AAD7MXF8_9AGAR|nr:hypothetical protein B0H16DRAFT_122446 [Mycena metata]
MHLVTELGQLARRRPYFVALVGGLNALAVISLYIIYNERRHSVTFSPDTIAPTSFSDALRLSALDHPNNSWIPLALSSCVFGMPTHYAPCAARTLPNLLYAEELIYPDFELREPYFAKEEHRQRWRAYAGSDVEFRQRAALNNGWVSYKGQAGQNIVFHRVKYEMGSFGADTWAAQACMSGLVDTSPIQPLTDADRAMKVLPSALVALSPDSYSFQHYLDRVTHIIAQGLHLVRGATTPYALTGRAGQKTVRQMWSQMGFPESHVLHSKPVAAETMVFSCRAVLVHPWLSSRTLELLGVERTSPPSPTRNKVVYMSRSDGRAANGGRRVVNEEAVLRGITELLTGRDKGEELVVFNPDDFTDVKELFAWFAANVIAVVGPHGGAMFNHRWANQDILVLEFMPTTRIAVMIWEEASVLSQIYAAIVVEPTEKDGSDMVIDVADVVSLLGQHLSVAEGEDPLRKSYPWKAKELGFR